MNVSFAPLAIFFEFAQKSALSSELDCLKVKFQALETCGRMNHAYNHDKFVRKILIQCDRICDFTNLEFQTHIRIFMRKH